MVLHKFLEPVAVILVLFLGLGVHKPRRLVHGNNVDLLQPFRTQYRQILHMVAFQIELESKKKVK